MTVAHTLYILMEICKGLQYAHEVTDPETGRELGIVHRDISPPNILVSKHGEVKIVDFGLAKATSQLESTDPGVVKGKFSLPVARGGERQGRRSPRRHLRRRHPACTSCSPASASSTARPTTRRSSWCGRPRCRRSRRRTPRSRRSSSRSCARRWRAISTSASSRRAICRTRWRSTCSRSASRSRRATSSSSCRAACARSSGRSRRRRPSAT